MIVLGIESTAHTFGIGIIDASGNSENGRCKVLANVTSSYTTEKEGMVPDDIIAHHKDVAESIFKKAFTEANVSWDDIDLMSYSSGPGIDPVLWVGYHKAVEWSEQNNKKLVQANHCCAHLSIGKVVNNAKDPVYLYVSGVNTQVLVFDSGKYRVIGETLDIGMGNMLDKFGRIIGLGFPAGPHIETLAHKGKYIELPYTVKGMDVSFSGILTKCTQLFERNQATKEDLCFSLQETAFAMATEVTERAMSNTQKNELILVGGVGANKRFCEMLDLMCKARGAVFYNVPMKLAGDQGAMIAWEGYLRRDEAQQVFKVNSKWRTDEV
jgi:glycoprotease/Kae1 family metallohydrolase